MNSLVLMILFLIIRPIIKGLAESGKNKQKWQKRQKAAIPSKRINKTFEEQTLKYPYTIKEIGETSYDYETPPVVEMENEAKETVEKEDTFQIHEQIEQEDFPDILDEENLLRSIILKEILDKPKCLR